MILYIIDMKLDSASRAPASGIFQKIEALQGERPWGRFLDAGTGTHSIDWVGSLATERWTAVTGAEAHAVQVADRIAPRRRESDRILVGNWEDARLLAGEAYDTVLADYLLGAIDGFAPYFQHRLFARLRPLVGQRLYVVGLEPYVIGQPDTVEGRLVWEIGRFRDSCLLLAGEQPYPEYPAQWVVDHLEASGYKVIAATRFANRYKQKFVNGQIDMCAPRLAKIADRHLARALSDRGEALRAEALDRIAREGSLSYGFDYLLAAEPV